jgi:hypothetical protein
MLGPSSYVLRPAVRRLRRLCLTIDEGLSCGQTILFDLLDELTAVRSRH